MSYSTILKYRCDYCLKETTFPEMTDGPLFAREGWVTIKIHTYTYHDTYQSDSGKDLDGLYCPDCVYKEGNAGLTIKLVRSK